MTRLASRSPAAPFSTSRPAPMPQYPPQATKTTEAQTLRQIVQEREEEIERLRAATKKAIALLVSYQNRIDGPGGRNLAECINQLQSLHPEWDVDSGGDDHASS